MTTSLCPCTSGAPFADCCQPIINGAAAPTAEALMRSRYTAFTLEDAAYLRHSWHPDTRPTTVEFALRQRWLGLKIKRREAGGCNDETGVVCFAARYKIDGRGHRLEECSRFVRLTAPGLSAGGRWVYLDGDIS